MKKIIILALSLMFLQLSIIRVSSLPRPKKNSVVGGMIGQIEINIDKDWEAVRAGTHYHEFWITLISNDTNKKYSVIATKRGLFYLLNIPPGKYTIQKCSFSYHTMKSNYYINPIIFGDLGIPFEITANKITILKHIKIFAEIFTEEKKLSTKYFLDEENIDEYRSFFKIRDKRKRWSGFEFISQLTTKEDSGKDPIKE